MQLSLDPVVDRPLVRAFEQASYRDEFLTGQVRLTLVSVYRMLESQTRVDRREGEARHTVRGASGVEVHYGGSWHNPIYVLSLSDPEVDRAHLSAEYGAYIIQLDNTAQFVRDLVEDLPRQAPPGREVLEVHLAPVRYNRDTLIEPEPQALERRRLIWAQKAERNAPDHEVRLAVHLSGPVQGAPKVWTVQTRPPAVRGQTVAT